MSVENAALDRTQGAEKFLFRIALFALIYAVLGFAIRGFVEPSNHDRFTGLVICHALLMTAWLSLFALQIYQKQTGRMARHRAIGKWSPLLATAIVGTGLTISFTASIDFDSPLFFLLNAVVFLCFGMLYALAIRHALSGNYAAHKRYLLVATLTFLGPASARWLTIVGGPALFAPVVLLVCVIGIPIIYDWLSNGRWHRASMVASGIVLGGLLAVGVIVASPLLDLLAPLYE